MSSVRFSDPLNSGLAILAMVNEIYTPFKFKTQLTYLIISTLGIHKMSGFEAESEIEEKDNTLVLFDMKGTKIPQYWKFIKLIAPNNSKKKWKSSECVEA